MIEAYFSGAELGLWGDPLARTWGFENFGFWAGLLGNWQPNYNGQSIVMFYTYGFLHAGFLHFAVNMLTFIPLGDSVARIVGNRRFLVIYGVMIVAGSLAFALWPEVSKPMVGASGGLFGLAGVLLSWDYALRRRDQRSIRPIVRSVILLILLNLALWWAMNGQLAWQTHLGGFIAGWFLGYWKRPTSLWAAPPQKSATHLGE
ncbi:MAG: rhomboid family intramembrane serine protease [Paracoccaceae bacterium]